MSPAPLKPIDLRQRISMLEHVATEDVHREQHHFKKEPDEGSVHRSNPGLTPPNLLRRGSHDSECRIADTDRHPTPAASR